MRVIIFIIFLLSIHAICFAGNEDTGIYPRAILIQLRSEHNRIQALTEAKRYSAVTEVEQDAIEITKRIKRDFHDNFPYCPVYYYVDTNAEKIKNKQFDGVVFNEDGTLAKNIVINSNSTDYLVAFYGYPVSQAKYKKVQTDTNRYTYDTDPPAGKGLVILNDKFLQLTYFYKLGYDELGFRFNKRDRRYFYQSKHFDMEYYPFARLFNRTMLDRYGRRRITKA